MILSPSLLAADFANIERDVRKIEAGGAQYLHVDVMDGHFVPNINFGPVMVESLKKISDLILDVHLMISNPEKYAETFLKAGADIITVHVETEPDMKYLLELTAKYNKKLAVAINPPTDITQIDPYLDYAEMVLIMTVNPGFGGQKFISDCVDKIKYVKAKKYDVDIQVDGGINLENLSQVVQAGANVIVAGSSVFNTVDPAETCKEFFKRGNAI